MLYLGCWTLPPSSRATPVTLKVFSDYGNAGGGDIATNFLRDLVGLYRSAIDLGVLEAHFYITTPQVLYPEERSPGWEDMEERAHIMI